MKFNILTLALTSTLLLTACGGGGEETSSSSPAASAGSNTSLPASAASYTPTENLTASAASISSAFSTVSNYSFTLNNQDTTSNVLVKGLDESGQTLFSNVINASSNKTVEFSAPSGDDKVTLIFRQVEKSKNYTIALDTLSDGTFEGNCSSAASSASYCVEAPVVTESPADP